MRVPERMDVSHRPVDPRRRHLEQLDAARDLDPAGRPADDAGVVRAGNRHVRPRVELEPILDQGVGSAELQHHARPHLGFVEVLRPARERVDLDEIAAHRLGERLEVRDRGDDPELAIGVRAGQRQTQQAQDCRDHHECASHESSPPRKDAPGGRRG